MIHVDKTILINVNYDHELRFSTWSLLKMEINLTWKSKSVYNEVD